MIGKTLIVLALVVAIHTQYNQELGLNLCHLAIASYCNPQKVQDWSCGPCLNSAIKMDNVQVFRNSSGNIVGFVGTSSFPSAMCKLTIYIRCNIQRCRTMESQQMVLRH